ncbi:hypothetical protein AHiyo8_19900 [Arthrobacter sp. Hiyo8]|uniref:hypothetical protein n=1 Tax=Arthrobacter sp. Hiyo1 TaxID=1588020 RepID=UPI000683984F|nr:hypothetical protein [Arthrobacter sp. Hiyo1]MDQ0240838.1 hypothetical protein [Arthrobacter bambusae]BAS13687.1 hypothetical protein AHiyo8_19900 [Arthrobacter sp. Hiyo8]GAP58467.1 hypothetical protein AHiyo1_15320 [Arthrobacter sp. Hiyo1]
MLGPYNSLRLLTGDENHSVSAVGRSLVQHPKIFTQRPASTVTSDSLLPSRSIESVDKEISVVEFPLDLSQKPNDLLAGVK